MSIEQLAPAEVARRLADRDDAVYLDVRSVDEFCNGHAAGALNIPLFHLDATTRQLVPNDDFLEVAAAALDPGQAVYCGCASGQRSMRAAMILRAAGFETLANVETGFSGKRDAFGQLVAPGWEACGLPVETGDGGDVAYATLLERAASRDE